MLIPDITTLQKLFTHHQTAKKLLGTQIKAPYLPSGTFSVLVELDVHEWTPR